MAAFHVDDRVNVKLEFDLAIRLGELILNSRPTDPSMRALGHQLVNRDEETSRKYAPARDELFYKEEMVSNEPNMVSEWKRPISSNSIRATNGMHEKVASKKVRWGIEPVAK